MNLLLKGLVSVCGVLALTAGASAQSYGRVDHAYFQDRDHDRDDHWDHDRLAREYRGAFYDRLQADLDRGQRAGYLREDDLRRFERAHREVGEFQAKWSRGVFDSHEMDEAIASVQRVLDIPSLRHEDREALREDLFNMRRFRAHMEGRR
jgi:hypothetical protein